jgi:Mg/Co/Ni transporter MgtE
MVQLVCTVVVVDRGVGLGGSVKADPAVQQVEKERQEDVKSEALNMQSRIYLLADALKHNLVTLVLLMNREDVKGSWYLPVT